MLSYTQLRTQVGNLTNSTAANLTWMTALMNENLRQINRMFEFDYDETSSTATTIASQQYYTLPYDYKKLIDISVTIGNINYHPREIQSRQQWLALNLSSAVKSNIPEWFFIQDTASGPQIGLYPIPSSSGNTITYFYKKRVKDLSVADYTTGTATVTNGTANVTGTGTTWGSAMIGRHLNLAESVSGDGYWYLISQVPSTTSITLAYPYGGNTVSAAYTIAQTPLLPEDYHMMPVYYAAAEYWRTKGNNLKKAEEYERKYNELLDELRRDRGNKTTNPVADVGKDVEIVNPNLTLTL